jgi:hypothetical protein
MEAKMMSANPPAVKLEKRATFRGTVSGLLEGSCHPIYFCVQILSERCRFHKLTYCFTVNF